MASPDVKISMLFSSSISAHYFIVSLGTLLCRTPSAVYSSPLRENFRSSAVYTQSHKVSSPTFSFPKERVGHILKNNHSLLLDS